jgi:hypothetical protein
MPQHEKMNRKESRYIQLYYEFKVHLRREIFCLVITRYYPFLVEHDSLDKSIVNEQSQDTGRNELINI